MVDGPMVGHRPNLVKCFSRRCVDGRVLTEFDEVFSNVQRKWSMG
jgi:hypothetical protein